MSQFADYILERTNDLIIEKPHGWATYRILGQSVYIVDIYTVPEFRKQGAASKLADEIAELAKVMGCTEMMGSVVPSSKGSTTSLKVLLAYGFSLKSAGQDYIFLRKDI